MKIRNRIKSLRHVRAGDLKPNPRNWRMHPQEQQDALRGVLAEVGYADALIARELPDGTLELVDGHLRAETTPDMKVPVLVTDLDEAEAAKVLATLDPLAAMAEQDTEKLAELLADIETESEALKAMLDELADSEPEPAREVHEDEVPDVPVDPITQPGDLWILGEHRVLCGDSTKAEDVERLMGGEKADLCFTSPPYGQQRDYTKEGKEKCQDWDGLMRGVFGNLPMADAGQVLVNLGLIHRDGEWIPYWESWIEWMREQGWRRFGWYVWDQGSGLPGDWSGRLAPSHEFVWHFNREAKKPEHCVPKDPKSIRDRTGDAAMRMGAESTQRATSGKASLNTYKIPDSVFRVQRQCGRIETGDYHPAVFPVAFPKTVMEAWPGSAYEPFCGSGTTLIAAEQLGRKCYGMEISPQYCDVIVKRWENLTGGKAELERK